MVGENSSGGSASHALSSRVAQPENGSTPRENAAAPGSGNTYVDGIEPERAARMSDEKPSALGETRPKLVESKQRWAREGRLLTGRHARPEAEQLPPGQREVKDWPVLDLGEQPEVALERWQLRVDGLVENPVAWDWATFRAQPQTRD